MPVTKMTGIFLKGVNGRDRSVHITHDKTIKKVFLFLKLSQLHPAQIRLPHLLISQQLLTAAA